MKYSVFIFFSFLFTTTFGQNVIIKDSATGKSVPQVTIVNEGKTKSSFSNENGVADISMFNANETLFFSHVSYSKFHEKKKVLKQNNFVVFLSKESKNLDEVIVTVFRKKEKTNRIAEQISVVSSEEIAKIAPQSSADLLANTVGVKVQKSQFGGGSPILRGMESNRVLLVVDGVRMNNLIYRKGHLQNAITVNPSLLEKVEVVFGPTSVTYGSDALGGVIHYKTKTPKLSSNRNVKLNTFSRYSSANNEISNTLTVEYQSKKWASLSSVSYSVFNDLRMGKNRLHGFKEWGKVFYYSNNQGNNYTPYPTKNNDVNLQKNTGYKQTDVLQKFYIPFSADIDFKLNMQFSTSSNIPRFDRLTEKNGEELKFAEWNYGPQNRLLISPQINFKSNLSWMEQGEITLAYQNIQESRIQRRFGSLNQATRTENITAININADFSASIAKKRNLAYGFEFMFNSLNSLGTGNVLLVENNKKVGYGSNFNVQSRYPDGGSDYIASSYYLNYRQDISKNATLNTGGRITSTYLSASWKDDTFLKLPSNSIRLQSVALTGTIGYVYKPTNKWQLNAVISSGFRSPNIDDIGKVREKNGQVTVPNVNLKPEYAYNFEVGMKKYLNNKKFGFNLSAYYTLLRNYISRDKFSLNGKNKLVLDGEEYAMVANVNKGNAYVYGGTLGYEGEVFKNWQTKGSLTYTKGKTLDSNEPMSSIPPLFGDLGISYTNDKIIAGINFKFNASKLINEYNISEGIDNHQKTPIINANATNPLNKYYGSPSWQTLGLLSKYTFNDNFALQLNINNLFDQHYIEFASGVSAPGRNVSISLFSKF